MVNLGELQIIPLLEVRIDPSADDADRLLEVVAENETFPPSEEEYSMQDLRRDERELRQAEAQTRQMQTVLTILYLTKSIHELKETVVEPPIDLPPNEPMFDSRAEVAEALADPDEVLEAYKHNDGLYWDGFSSNIAYQFLNRVQSIDDEVVREVQNTLHIHVAPPGIEHVLAEDFPASDIDGIHEDRIDLDLDEFDDLDDFLDDLDDLDMPDF